MTSVWESQERRVIHEVGLHSGIPWEEVRLRLECLKRNFRYRTDFPKLRAYIEALTDARRNGEKCLSWDSTAEEKELYLDHSAFAKRHELNPAALAGLDARMLEVLAPGAATPEQLPAELADIFDLQPVLQWVHDERAWVWGADALLDRLEGGDEIREKLAALHFDSRVKAGVWQRTLEDHQRLLLLDLRFDRRAILRGVEKYLDSLAAKGEWQEQRKRFRQEAWQCLKIWDLREKKMSFKTIGATFGIAEDSAIHAFYRAYELTQGAKYRTPSKELAIGDLKTVCATCGESATCTTLCPQVLAFVNQDEKHSDRRLISVDPTALENLA